MAGKLAGRDGAGRMPAIGQLRTVAQTQKKPPERGPGGRVQFEVNSVFPSAKANSGETEAEDGEGLGFWTRSGRI